MLDSTTPTTEQGFRGTRGRVVSSEDGPGLLPMRRADGRALDVASGWDAESIRGADHGRALAIVSATQSATLADLLGSGYAVCAAIPGKAYVLASDPADCPP